MPFNIHSTSPAHSITVHGKHVVKGVTTAGGGGVTTGAPAAGGGGGGGSGDVTWRDHYKRMKRSRDYSGVDGGLVSNSVMRCSCITMLMVGW